MKTPSVMEARPATGELAGRTAIVTSGAAGIGRAFCRRLAADGAAVVVADPSDGSATVGMIADAGGRTIVLSVNLDSVFQLVKRVLAGWFEVLAQRQVIKRAELPEDLVGPLAFLVSDDAAFVTGQTVLVDGGWRFA